MKVIWLTAINGRKFFVLPAWIELGSPDTTMLFGETRGRSALSISGKPIACQETVEEIAEMLEKLDG